MIKSLKDAVSIVNNKNSNLYSQREIQEAFKVIEPYKNTSGKEELYKKENGIEYYIVQPYTTVSFNRKHSIVKYGYDIVEVRGFSKITYCLAQMEKSLDEIKEIINKQILLKRK